MLTRDFPTTPAVCVLKTSKNVTPSMKVPVWNTIRHGEQMPADKAAVREVSVSKLTSSRELGAFRRSVMFGRSGAVLYSVAPGAPKASFIERPEMLRDQLGVVSVSKNVSQCDNELGERLLGLNAIVDKASVTLEDLRMENTVLMGHAYAARTELDSCILDGFATVVGGEHKDLYVSGESVVICDVKTYQSTSLSGSVVIGGGEGLPVVADYRLAADGSVNPTIPGGSTGNWVREVARAARGTSSTFEVFCLNSALHRKKSEENCMCGLVLPLALAGHPVAISYLLNRAGLSDHVPAEYADMTEEQMVDAVTNCVAFPYNNVLSYRDITDKGFERVSFGIGSREDWYQHLREVYVVENPQEIHKYHR